MERLQDVLVKDKNEEVRSNLAQNPALKLKPAILLYCNENEDVIESLCENNMGFWRQIRAMEKYVLQNTNISFVALSHTDKRRGIQSKF